MKFHAHASPSIAFPENMAVALVTAVLLISVIAVLMGVLPARRQASTADQKPPVEAPTRPWI